LGVNGCKGVPCLEGGTKSVTNDGERQREKIKATRFIEDFPMEGVQG